MIDDAASSSRLTVGAHRDHRWALEVSALAQHPAVTAGSKSQCVFGDGFAAAGVELSSRAVLGVMTAKSMRSE